MSKYKSFSTNELKREYERIEQVLKLDPINIEERKNKRELYPFVRFFSRGI